MTVYTRGFELFDSSEPARKLELVFAGRSIQTMKVLEGPQGEFIRLAPTPIGGIYPKRKEDRELIRLEDIPPLLGSTIIAVEDRDFVDHWGVSFKGIARAFWVNVRSGKLVQGGSTLTQQLVKNLFLTDDRKISRKINEAVMALLLEWHYSKSEILETYLNEVYLGQSRGRQLHGFGLAAKRYFRKPVSELQTQEIALLVGMVKGASYYNPRRHPERAKARRNVVLGVMADQGLITSDELEFLSAQPLSLASSAVVDRHDFPAFIDLVKSQLLAEYSAEDLSSEGLKIYTTLSLSSQRKAERALNTKLSQLEKRHKLEGESLQGAVIVTAVGVGEVEALVGDRNSQFAGFNRAINARRQIGSLAKPIVYLSALRTGNWHLASALNDGEVRVEGPGGKIWSPDNFDQTSHGSVLLIDALANSYNRATARLGMQVGLTNVAKTFAELGFEEGVDAYPAMLLGATEMSPFDVTEIYHTIANDGVRTPIRSIRGVTSQQGELLSRYSLDIAPTINEYDISLLHYGLQTVMREGTGRWSYNILPDELAIAGKTGHHK